MLKVARIIAGTALAVAVLGGPPQALAAPVVAKNITAQIVSNGGGNRLDVLVRVATGRPKRRCSGVATLHGRRSRLRPLMTGARGGRQWHWYLGEGAKRGRLTVKVTCRFPNGRIVKKVQQKVVGPGPHPRRAFKHVVQPRSLRIEAWAPARWNPLGGSGGSADLYPKGQCTWYVARERPDLPYFAGRDGDAKNWIASAERHKLPTGLAPRVGAVAVFQPGQYGAGIYGHVAYVTKVDGDRITVREANYGTRPAGSSRTTGWAGVRFIYKEALPAPAPQATPLTPPSVVNAVKAPIWPNIDLLTATSTRLDGLQWGSVSRAGDVNGDNYQDVVVYGAVGASSLRSAWVVFGSPALGGRVDLTSLGSRGFRVDSPQDAEGGAIWSATGVGDVNGDGKGDIALATPDAGYNGHPYSGSAYVVFGKADTGTIALEALGAHGYRIDGATTYLTVGKSISGVGDVNGDGRADVAIGAMNDNNNSLGGGSAYVVFGKAAATPPVDLGALGPNGFRIDGAHQGDRIGMAVAGVGDMDGDRRGDIAVSGFDNMTHNGRAYVVRGSADTTPVDLATVDGFSARAFEIAGPPRAELFGAYVGAVGDVNGDGLPDVAVGAPEADNNARGRSGSTYVVFGKADNHKIDVERLGAGGFRIDGAKADDGHGGVGKMGDVNGDGLADLSAGRYQADFAGRQRAGIVQVMFGKRDSAPIDLASVGATAGFAIGGAAADDEAGGGVGVGDVNGDGRGDLAVSTRSGAYLVYGRPAPTS